MKERPIHQEQLLGGVGRGATISTCGQYRYDLVRRWGQRPFVLFVMLNPSTADALLNDPTIRRCIGFAMHWGYGGLYVVNVYAYRATLPAELWGVADPVGPENDRYVRQALDSTARTVVAWGNNARPADALRTYQIIREAKPQRSVLCLGTTARGQPKHPLYLPKDASLSCWVPDALVAA